MVYISKVSKSVSSYVKIQEDFCQMNQTIITELYSVKIRLFIKTLNPAKIYPLSKLSLTIIKERINLSQIYY